MRYFFIPMLSGIHPSTPPLKSHPHYFCHHDIPLHQNSLFSHFLSFICKRRNPSPSKLSPPIFLEFNSRGVHPPQVGASTATIKLLTSYSVHELSTRGLSVSCSKACHCSDMCTNRPFRKEKKIKVVKTNFCGWGVEALESIEKGDFVIEYIGEVIDDALCAARLWDMKYRGDQNFYMCEIQKDFTIDATFKGNAARFLNHSCDPNCKLEKWQVDGETRLGVFASRSIEVGEPLTYDYRFVHFGPLVKCSCGEPNCQGFLGSKRKATQLTCWGCTRKRKIVKKAQS